MPVELARAIEALVNESNALVRLIDVNLEAIWLFSQYSDGKVSVEEIAAEIVAVASRTGGSAVQFNDSLRHGRRR